MPDFKQKYWKWLIPILCAAYCFLEAGNPGDFYIFLSAASDLNIEENIFEKKYVDGYHYYYSVLFALILKPFVSMPYFWVKFFWQFFNALLFFDLLKMLYRSEFVKNLDLKKQNLFIILVFIVSLRFFVDNIHTSQITILILWCCIKGVYLISKDKPLTGAMVLAIGINIKLLPIVFIPYLIYRGYFKAALFTVLFYFIFLFAPSAIIGHQYNMDLLATWLKLINPANAIHVLDVDERSFHGLSTLLSTLLVKNVPDVYALNIPRNIADVSMETLSLIILIVRGSLIAFTLYFLRLSVFQKAKSVFLQALEVSYILLLIPLIFPHQQHYAFLFAVPAFVVVMYDVIVNSGNSKYKKVIIVFLVLIYLTFNLRLLLGAYNEYYDHFKIITYSALLLIPLLVIVSKNARKPDHFSP